MLKNQEASSKQDALKSGNNSGSSSGAAEGSQNLKARAALFEAQAKANKPGSSSVPQTERLPVQRKGSVTAVTALFEAKKHEAYQPSAKPNAPEITRTLVAGIATQLEAQKARIQEKVQRCEGELELSKQRYREAVEKFNQARMNLTRIETAQQETAHQQKSLSERKASLEQRIAALRKTVDPALVVRLRPQSNDKHRRFLRAVERGDVSGVRECLQNGADINQQDALKRSVVHLAILHGLHDILALLLQHRPDLEVRNQEGYTPLHCAVFKDDITAVKQLMAAKCNLAALTLEGESAAALTTDAAIQALLQMKRPDPSEKADNPLTEGQKLLKAALKGQCREAAAALGNGASVDALDEEGRTALHQAAANGHREIVQLLITRKASLNLADKEGYAPLHSAAFADQKESVQLLLEGRCDPTLKAEGGTADELTSDDEIGALIRLAKIKSGP